MEQVLHLILHLHNLLIQPINFNFAQVTTFRIQFLKNGNVH